nr:MAG TPA: hypothetical protein [Caudoviricetes sp.]
MLDANVRNIIKIARNLKVNIYFFVYTQNTGKHLFLSTHREEIIQQV